MLSQSKTGFFAKISEKLLYEGIFDNNLKKIKQALASGVNVNTKYGDDSCLNLALSIASCEIAEKLIEADADINEKHTSSSSLLHLVCSNCFVNSNDQNKVNLLLKHKVDVQAKTSDDSTALHFLCGSYMKGLFLCPPVDQSTLITIAEKLLVAGIDKAARNKKGKTALDYAKENKLPELEKFLREANVEELLKNKNYSSEFKR